MKKYIPLFLIVLLTACGQQDKSNTETVEAKDSTEVIEDSTEYIVTDTLQNYTAEEKALLSRSMDVLATLQDSNYTAFAAFIHPDLGIRFSPYGYISTKDNPVLTAAKFNELVENGKKIKWGIADGSGEPIELSWKDYVKKYVYEHDYRNSSKVAVNEFIAKGNSLNNLDSIYPGATFSEHYFPGFDPKANGMDWATLRLVFRAKGTRLYLVAIVHDIWTI